MRISNRFTKGIGLYKCRSCERSTRDTGHGDNEHLRLCVECFDLSGLENTVLDGGDLTAGDKASIISAVEFLASKGARVSQWDDLLQQAKR